MHMNAREQKTWKLCFSGPVFIYLSPYESDNAKPYVDVTILWSVLYKHVLEL